MSESQHAEQVNISAGPASAGSGSWASFLSPWGQALYLLGLRTRLRMLPASLVLVDRYGLYGSGTRYSALTYLNNRLSSYSKRKTPGLLEPMPVGWKPQEGRHLRRTTREERQRFGNLWIAVYRRRRAAKEETQ